MAVTHRTIVTAINTPGGITYEWRDARAKEMRDRGIATSPTNSPFNAKHRGGKVGTYKASWRWERGRSSDVVLRAILRNRAPHAVFVELGRSASTQYQRFSWKRWTYKGRPGQIRYIGHPPKGMTAALLANWLKLAFEDPGKLPEKMRTPWGGRKTGARKPRNTLRNAVNYVMTPWGFSKL